MHLAGSHSEYRWLFRREGDTMRISILSALGTLTGWGHLFWAECGVEELRNVIMSALESFRVLAHR